MFEITEQAIRQLNKKFNGSSYFRITIDSGGCSGFSYNFSNENSIQNKDIILYDHKDSFVKIITDEDSEEFLKNSQLSYVDNLEGSFFSLKLKNAVSYCGCGTSFSV